MSKKDATVVQDDADLTLEQLRVLLRQFVAERDWGQFHDPKNLAMLLLSEAGELAGELRWVTNDAVDDFVRGEPARERIRRELADVGIALLLFADRAEIDLLEAIRDKIEVNRAHYPAGESRGQWARPERTRP